MCYKKNHEKPRMAIRDYAKDKVDLINCRINFLSTCWRTFAPSTQFYQLYQEPMNHLQSTRRQK
uniref:Uncharacterized protein n=1 Tax=Solanum tuberosum TaxID=4113 RepID=M1BJ50_SOLTU